MSADDGRPLEKNLIAAVGFVLADVVVGMSKLQAQAVKLAQIPSHEWRIADGLFARALNARRVVEKKSRGPILVELQLGVTVAAVGLLAFGRIVEGEAFAVVKKLRADVSP